jgi:transposase
MGWRWCSTAARVVCFERIYGDGGYQGPKAAKAAAKAGYWTIEIVERLSTAVGFEVLPKRWIVERTFACSAGSAA